MAENDAFLFQLSSPALNGSTHGITTGLLCMWDDGSSTTITINQPNPPTSPRPGPPHSGCHLSTAQLRPPLLLPSHHLPLFSSRWGMPRGMPHLLWLPWSLKDFMTLPIPDWFRAKNKEKATQSSSRPPQGPTDSPRNHEKSSSRRGAGHWNPSQSAYGNIPSQGPPQYH